MAKFQYQTFFASQDIKQFVFSQYLWSSFIKSWQGEKEGKREAQKCEYLENKKSFPDEIKPLFIIL